MIKIFENQSAPKLENRKTSPCSPRAPNLLPDGRMAQFMQPWSKGDLIAILDMAESVLKRLDVDKDITMAERQMMALAQVRLVCK